MDDPAKSNPRALSRISVGVDGSDYARKAFAVAADIALTFDSKLYAISVMHLPSTLGAKAETVKELEAELSEQARGILSKYAADAKAKHGIIVETIVAVGVPSRVIMETAKEKDVDLVVVGSRGLGGLRELFLGSVAYDIARKAEETDLVVK